MTMTPEQQRVVEPAGAGDEQDTAPPAAAPPPAGADADRSADPHEPARADPGTGSDRFPDALPDGFPGTGPHAGLDAVPDAVPDAPAGPRDPVHPARPVDAGASDPVEPTDQVHPTDPPEPVAPTDPIDPIGPTHSADQPEQMIPPQTALSPYSPHTATRADPVGPRQLRDAPGWVRWIVFPLLVLVPAGYMAESADQSRDSGVAIEEAAATRHLTMVAPSLLQKRIYDVPIPVHSTRVGYLETNSWDISELYVQFTTTPGGLDTFLAKVGTSRAALRGGQDAVNAGQAAAVGWIFRGIRSWAGVQLHVAGDKPDHDIMVDLTDDDAPRVFVVSTVNFQHGFGGG